MQLCSIVTSCKKVERQICSRGCQIYLENTLITVSTRVIKNISIWPICQAGPNILDISKSGKNQTGGLCKISYSIFSIKHTWHSLKADNQELIAVQMIKRCINHPSHSESFNAVQIFQRCIIPWLAVQVIRGGKNFATK